jgi:hypothetical protein
LCSASIAPLNLKLIFNRAEHLAEYVFHRAVTKNLQLGINDGATEGLGVPVQRFFYSAKFENGNYTFTVTPRDKNNPFNDSEKTILQRNMKELLSHSVELAANPQSARKLNSL